MQISNHKLQELETYIAEQKWDYAARLIETLGIEHLDLHSHRINMWVHYLAGITYLHTGQPAKALIHLGTFHNLTNNTTETSVYAQVHNVRPPTLEETDRCKRLLEDARQQTRALLSKKAELKGDPRQIEAKIAGFENAFIEPAGQTRGGCFIATACCGSVIAPEVVLLSTFRDQVLQTSMPGRLLIRLYYVASPILAESIPKRSLVRALCRRVIVVPAVRCAAVMMRRSPK